MLYKIETFVGQSRFPIDMLRYDQCFPKESRDVEEILASNDTSSNGPFMVSVLRPKSLSGGFNYARWESFGWKKV